MQKEIWKSIPNYEGYYEVSNWGRVKSLDRVVPSARHGNQRVKERILKAGINSHGYLGVVLLKNGISKSFKVHTLVVWSFHNLAPNGKRDFVIDHINEVKTDNRLENLQVISFRENVSRSRKNSISKYTGVVWHKVAGKWKAQIHIKGKNKHLGLFTSELEASKAYQKALDGIT